MLELIEVTLNYFVPGDEVVQEDLDELYWFGCEPEGEVIRNFADVDNGFVPLGGFPDFRITEPCIGFEFRIISDSDNPHGGGPVELLLADISWEELFRAYRQRLLDWAAADRVRILSDCQSRTLGQFVLKGPKELSKVHRLITSWNFWSTEYHSYEGGTEYDCGADLLGRVTGVTLEPV